MFYKRFLVIPFAACALAGCEKEATCDSDAAPAVEDAAPSVEIADDVTATVDVTLAADATQVQ